MLSVIDLIDAGTLTTEQACWLLTRVEEGASWLVGARPGGAGKTTIMSALLTMLPPGEPVRLAAPGFGWEACRAGECAVAYEIGPGGYEAYIWGEQVRNFFRLGAQGCRIVSNLHADTLAEAEAQIVGDCGASAADFAACDLFLPIALHDRDSNCTPRIESISYGTDGKRCETGRTPRLTVRQQEIASFIDSCREKGLQTVEDVRAAWLDSLDSHDTRPFNGQT
jgi:hypothetical protein